MIDHNGLEISNNYELFIIYTIDLYDNFTTYLVFLYSTSLFQLFVNTKYIYL